MRATVAAARLAAPALVAVALLGACSSDDEERAPVPESAEAVEIRTEDGLTLDGRYFRGHSEQQLVILLHAYPSDQTEWFDFAEALQGRGLSVLTLDFRGYGASEGSKDADASALDTRAAIEWARSRDAEQIALVGASMGGTAAIVAATEAAVTGVVAISAPVSMGGMDAEDAIAEIEAPILLIAAEDDISAAESLDELAEDAGLDGDRVLLVGGRAHGTELLGEGGDERVRTRIYDFLFELWGGVF